MSAFNPIKCGFIIVEEDGEKDYVIIQDNKVIATLHHVNYFQGLPFEWSLYKIIHCVNGTTNDDRVFAGNIPTNEFAKELIVNTIY